MARSKEERKKEIMNGMKGVRMKGMMEGRKKGKKGRKEERK